MRSNTNFVDCIAVIEPFCCLTAHATNFLAVTLSGFSFPAALGAARNFHIFVFEAPTCKNVCVDSESFSHR